MAETQAHEAIKVESGGQEVAKVADEEGVNAQVQESLEGPTVNVQEVGEAHNSTLFLQL